MSINGSKFKSKSIEYETPQVLFDLLNNEFHFTLDVCASKKNTKVKNFFSKEDDSLKKKWKGICWMNPPFDNKIKHWVMKARNESFFPNCIVCCLIPVRSNTVWWKEVCKFAEVRFIIGEVNFNNLQRGLWLPMCFLIFGTNNVGKFSIVDYKSLRK